MIAAGDAIAETAGDAVARFRAMSVEIAITGSGVTPDRVAAAGEMACDLAGWWEDLFSRFRPGSLLCRLNAAGGADLPADPVFLDVLDAARRAVITSRGVFDPAILPALEAAGYDRDIDLVSERAGAGDGPDDVPPLVSGVEAWRQVEIDRAAGLVRLPAGMRIDLGGIAKGAYVDLLASRLSGWPGGLVDAGGDLRAWGVAPDGGPWRIALENPLMPGRDLAFADLVDPSRAGGVATSGVLKRRWGERSHHLIDPRSGRPATSGLAAVTAFAPTCVAAEIAAKTLLIGAAPGGTAAIADIAIAVGVSLSGAPVIHTRGDRDAVELDIPLDSLAAGDPRS